MKQENQQQNPQANNPKISNTKPGIRDNLDSMKNEEQDVHGKKTTNNEKVTKDKDQ